jgi:hypothetical protein
MSFKVGDKVRVVRVESLVGTDGEPYLPIAAAEYLGKVGMVDFIDSTGGRWPVDVRFDDSKGPMPYAFDELEVVS